MTEPSLLAAEIPMTAAACKKFLAGEAGETFAAAAAAIIIGGAEDFFVLRYLGDAGALYFACLFRWANRAEDIAETPVFEALSNAGAFMKRDARGRIVISRRALNFLEQGVEASYVVDAAGRGRDDAVDAAEMDRIQANLNAYLFKAKPGERTFHQAMRSGRVLDPAVRKKVDALLEKHRGDVARGRLPGATEVAPVRLFAHYHFNGRFVVHADSGSLAPLPGVDAHGLRQTVWGAADDRHVLVGGRVLATDPKTFRMLPRGENLAFYVDAERVYGPDLAPLADADPKSFAWVADGYARDRSRWYAFDGTPLDDVGASWRIDSSLFFLKFHVLIGEGAVYMGKTRLPVDARSFAIRRIAKYPPGSTSGFALCWASDRDGDLLISARDHEGELRIERAREPERLWDLRRAQADEPSPSNRAFQSLRDATPRSWEDPVERDAFAAFFEGWMDANLEMYRRERPLDDQLWGGIERYFHCCRHRERWRDMLALHEKIGAIAWIHPALFHHTACMYVALGRLSEAVGEVHGALAFGYPRIDDLFADPDIAPLAAREDFQRLRAFREGNRQTGKPFLPDELIQSVARMPAIPLRSQIASLLSQRFFVPDEAAISAAYAQSPQTAESYRRALAAILNAHARSAWREGRRLVFVLDLYRAAGDIAGLSPATHLIGAASLLREGYFWNDLIGDDAHKRPEFSLAAAALRRMRESLAADASAAEDPFWREVSSPDALGAFV